MSGERARAMCDGPKRTWPPPRPLAHIVQSRSPRTAHPLSLIHDDAAGSALAIIEDT